MEGAIFFTIFFISLVSFATFKTDTLIVEDFQSFSTEPLKPKEKTNCPNCGAPRHGCVCDYCGTPFI